MPNEPEAQTLDRVLRIFKAEELIFLLRRINLHLSTQLELSLKEKDISGIQAYFMVYLLRHHPQGTYLTELCREIGVSKPTLSVLMKKLREKGYLTFQENPEDIRKKKVLPTEKLMAEGNEFLQKANQMEDRICNVLTQQEKAQLQILAKKFLVRLVELEQEQGQTKSDRRYFKREKSFTTAQAV